MTGIDRRGDTPMGPPWPVDVLADLHAGVLDADVAQRLWPRVREDAEASAVLDALDATLAELGGLAAAPVPPIPTQVAHRLDMAIGEEARRAFPAPRVMPPPAAPVVDLARARRRRGRRIGWATGVLVAAAVAAVVVVTIPRGGSSITGVAAPPPTASQPPGGADQPVRLTTGELTSGTTVAAALRRGDYGSLSVPSAMAACLRANGVSGAPVGGMQVVFNGTPGTLLILTTGTVARYRVLVVGQNCAAGTPDRLADVTVGGPAPTH